MVVIFKMESMKDNAKTVEIEPLDLHWVRITINDNGNETSAEIRTEDFTEAYNGCRQYVFRKSEVVRERLEKSKTRTKAQNDE